MPRAQKKPTLEVVTIDEAYHETRESLSKATQEAPQPVVVEEPAVAAEPAPQRNPPSQEEQKSQKEEQVQERINLN